MEKTLNKKQSELPPNKIVMLNGQVQRIEEWTLWNLEPFMTIQIGRETNHEVATEHGGFFSCIGNPEHVGVRKRGTLTEVLSELHSSLQPKYFDLFELRNFNKATVRSLGFTRFVLEEQEG